MAKYGVVETTKITEPCFDVKATVDVENGWVVKKGDIATGEKAIYKAEVPAATDEVYLAANPAWDYNDSSIINQNEENFINKSGKPFRVYALKKDNLFAVLDYSITDNTTLAVGDYIGVDGTTMKLKDLGTSDPGSTAFMGKVIDITEYGFAYCTGTAGNVGATGKKVTIEVVRNTEIGRASCRERV